MSLTKKEIKQRYFDRVYREAKEIDCACGCGIKLKNKDRYGRDKKFINGHNGRKYDDPKQYKKEWEKRNRISRKKYQIHYYKLRKRKLIELLGGKCESCGFLYDQTNGCCFQFHHKDPKTKKMNLSTGKIWTAWKKILKEVKKCQLLCANCHFKQHSSKY